MTSTPSTIFRKITLAMATAAILLGTTPAGNAAVFAKYDGIDGESKDANHGKWIDVLSIRWGMARPVAEGATGELRRRAPLVAEDLVLTIEYEKSAPKLMEKCVRGQIIPKLEIELTATFGGARATYLKYEMTNVMITSYQVGASDNGDSAPPSVVVGCNFEEVKVTYTEYDSAGGKKGNIETQWVLSRGE